MASTPIEFGSAAGILSFVLDAVGDVLTAEQRLELQSQLIRIRPSGVAPGDLITADNFNDMLGDINDLMSRVAALEGGITEARIPVITRIEPNIVTVGAEMRVIGENLTPGLLTRIEVADSRIPKNLLKLGSGPTKLIFDAPGVSGIADDGTPVTMLVANEAGSDQAAFVLRPGEADRLVAPISYVLKSITPDETLKANKDYTLAFELEIESSHAETFLISSNLQPVPGAGWTAAVQGDGDIDVPLSSGAPVKRSVTVLLHTGGAGTGGIVLGAKAKRFTAFSSSSLPFPVSINAAVDPTDGPIQFLAPSITGDQNKKRFADGKILVTKATAAAAETVRLRIPMTVTETGSYSVTAEPASGNASGWAVTLISTTPVNHTNIAVEFPRLEINIVAKNGNPANDEIVFTVTGQGAAPDATRRIVINAVDQMPV